MPWQRGLVDVAGELDDTGGMRWPHVVVLVPRRAGKSVAVLASLLQRLATGPGQRCWYTAQTRADAALTFRDEWSPLIEASPLYPRAVSLRRSNGSESVSWRPTRSTLSLFAPGPTALHGQDADTAVIDEAWSFTLDAGGAIEAGVQPAQLTRPRRQLWVVSAGGTDQSTWLAHWRQLGRDGTPGVALIEYAAADDDDPDDPAVWARVHPAVGYTVTLDAIASLHSTLDREQFARAVCGLWTTGAVAPARLPGDGWSGCLDPAAAPGGRALAYGVDVAHEGAAAAIAAASIDADGRGVVELVEHAPGTGWVPDRWRSLRARNRGRLFADQLGPAAPVVDALARARLPVELLTTSDYAAACGQLLDDVRTDRIRHRGQPALDAAALTTPARAVGDRWVWERRGRDASPIVAATLALWGARHPAAVPFVRVST